MFSSKNPVYRSEQLIQNIQYLLSQARDKKIPVYYIQHNEPAGGELENGTNGWPIYSQISPSEADTIVQKTTLDSFFRTHLDEQLKRQGISHLVLTGVQTEFCVATTCRKAFSLDYRVTLVGDAHSTWGSDELTAKQIIHHHNRVLRSFADICKTAAVSL
ncbi:MAG: cysteine hydrolase [Sporolactobacillus sp.]|jgi:nicotinamidase-related amidase|nr:cysteine hydrolase [Sporolactobacillus sp.]